MEEADSNTSGCKVPLVLPDFCYLAKGNKQCARHEKAKVLNFMLFLAVFGGL